MAQEHARTGIADMGRQMQALFNMNGAAAPQLESVLQLQEELAEELGSFAQNWYRRRHEAIETAFKTLREVNSDGKADPAAALQAMSEWQRGAIERLSADMQDWTAFCEGCANHAAKTAHSQNVSIGADLDGAGQTTRIAETVTAGKGNGKEASKTRIAGHATPV
jgi:hypothetical protein